MRTCVHACVRLRLCAFNVHVSKMIGGEEVYHHINNVHSLAIITRDILSHACKCNMDLFSRFFIFLIYLALALRTGANN